MSTTTVNGSKLSPLQEKLARVVYSKIGRLFCPSFEIWKFVVIHDGDPSYEILTAEMHARIFERYVFRHPEAKDSAKIAVLICLGPDSFLTKEETEASSEIQILKHEAWDRAWIPLVAESVEFPSDAAIVLEYAEVVEERDRKPFPNLLGKDDPRQVLHAADIIGAKDSASQKQYLLYGRDCLDEKGESPEGSKVVLVRLNIEDKAKGELGKMAFVVKMIKGKYDES